MQCRWCCDGPGKMAGHKGRHRNQLPVCKPPPVKHPTGLCSHCCDGSGKMVGHKGRHRNQLPVCKPPPVKHPTGLCSHCCDGSGKMAGHKGPHRKQLPVQHPCGQCLGCFTGSGKMAGHKGQHRKRPPDLALCKQCDQAALTGNYGFCAAHRAVGSSAALVANSASVAAAVGQSVCAVWPGDGTWYPGIVMAINSGNGEIKVEWNDDRTTDWVPARQLKPGDNSSLDLTVCKQCDRAAIKGNYGFCAVHRAVDSRAADEADVTAGQSVCAVWPGDGTWYPGIVMAINSGNGEIKVEWNDDRTTDWVPARQLKPGDNSSTGKLAHSSDRVQYGKPKSKGVHSRTGNSRLAVKGAPFGPAAALRPARRGAKAKTRHREVMLLWGNSRNKDHDSSVCKHCIEHPGAHDAGYQCTLCGATFNSRTKADDHLDGPACSPCVVRPGASAGPQRQQSLQAAVSCKKKTVRQPACAQCADHSLHKPHSRQGNCRLANSGAHNNLKRAREDCDTQRDNSRGKKARAESYCKYRGVSKIKTDERSVGKPPAMSRTESGTSEARTRIIGV